MPFSNGTLISNAGQVNTLDVANNYVPVAGDSAHGGTLHDVLGNMYICTAALAGAGDVFINGILHTLNGVRYVVNAVGVNNWPEGFATDVDGRQAIRTIQINTAFIRGIGRQTTSRRMNTVAGTGPVAPGNLTLQANVFENVQSFGTDQSVVGVQVTSSGIYQFSAEADTLNPFWQDVQFGTQWVDDAGASSDQFEAQLVPLNIGSVVNPTFIGWAGYNTWVTLDQNLGWYDFNDQPATSSNGGILQVEIREIAVPGNIVTGVWEGHADNEP